MRRQIRLPFGRAMALAVTLALVLLGLPQLLGVASAAATDPRIDLRVLVVTDGQPSVEAIATQLDREGVPYTKVAVGAQTIDAAFLADSATNTARFDAVVLPNQAGGGLTAAELTALTTYERQYGIRQVDAYNVAGPSMGLGPLTYSGPLDGGTATVTDAGRTGPFSYLTGTVPMADLDPNVNESNGYLAQPASPLVTGETFTPLVTATVGSAGGVLVGVDTRDGRDEMVLTAAYNPAQQWWDELAHGVVTWMTRGIHLGYQRNWFNVQVDDVFLPDSRWSAASNCTPGDDCVDPNVTTTDIRMTPADVARLVGWQAANDFTLDMVFNGGGSLVNWEAQNPDAAPPAAGFVPADPLRDAFLTAAGDFTWINHTYTHQFLGCIQIAPVATDPPGTKWHCATPTSTAPQQDTDVTIDPSTLANGVYWMSTAQLTAQIQTNIDWAKQNNLPNFDPTELVTGEHSGLTTEPEQHEDNPYLAGVLSSAGITYTASDNSREPDQRSVGTTLTVPRYPMNIFYNAGTYQDEVDEYNWYYVSKGNATEPGGGICDANPATSTCINPLPSIDNAVSKTSFDTYIKPLEIRNALGKILSNSPRPFYAHQSNLSEDGILYPVVEGILDQYRAGYAASAPLVQTDLIGQGQELRRMGAWQAASATTTAYLDSTGVHVPGGGTAIPLTMPAGSTTPAATLDSYGGELSGWTTGDVTSTPTTPMGGFVPAPAITAPTAPTGLTGTPGNAAVTLSWTASTSDGGTPLTAYLVTVTPGTGTPSTWYVTPAKAGDPVPTTTTVTGLTNGMPYTFSVVAQNDRFLQSPPLGPTASITPNPVLAAAPTGVQATPGNASATVSWTAPTSDGGAAIAGYVINAYPSGSSTPLSPPTSIPIWNATSGVVPTLVNGTSYTFTVAAVTSAGNGTFSPESNAVTPVTTPSAATIGTVTTGDQTASLTWTAPTDTGGSPITGWVVQAVATGSTTPSGTVAIDPAKLSATITGLTNGTTYTLSVQAHNAQGDGTPVTTTATPTAPVVIPGAPTISTVATGDKQVTVTWRPPADGTAPAITGYSVAVLDATGAATTIPAVTAGATATSAVVTGLTNGTGYEFTVTGLNGATIGIPSAAFGPVTPAPPITVPTAPTIGTPTAGDGSATVTWTAPTSDGGSPITGYTVRAYDGTGTLVATAPAGKDATSLVVGPLTNGSPHTFDVAAVNAIGTGTASARSVAVTPAAPTVPGAPTISSVVRGNTSVVLGWTPPTSDGNSAITDYLVDVYTGTDPTPAQIDSRSTGLGYTATGLVNGTSYRFTVTAVNGVGQGTPSATSAAVTPAGVPGAPPTPTVTAGAGSATVAWTVPTDIGGSPITQYVVSAFANGSPTPAKTQTVAASGLSVAITGLTNGTAYTFTVAATNGVGTGPASAPGGPVTPLASLALPGAPVIGTTTPGNKAATVTWTAPTQTGTSAISGYVVSVFSGTSSTPLKTATGGATATSLTVTGLTNGTTYTFTVAARNASGTGPASASTSVTPAAVPNAPAIGTATAGDQFATVTWKTPASTGGSPITGYLVTAYSGTTVVGTTPAEATATSLQVSGLTNGTRYTFTVAAANAMGTGAASGKSNAVTPAALAPAPTIGTVTPANASAKVTWTVPSSTGGSAITGYRVAVFPAGASTPSTTVTAGRAATSVTVSGLTNGTAYTFTVAAVTAAGTGAASAPSTSVTPAAKPDAPRIGTATARNASATVTWTAPTHTGGVPLTGYTVTTYTGGSAVGVQTVDPSLTQVTVVGLPNGTNYRFTVAAVNSTGTGSASAKSNAVTPVAG